MKIYFMLILSIGCFYFAYINFFIYSQIQRSGIDPFKPIYKNLIYIVLDGLRFDGFIKVNKEGFYYNNFNLEVNHIINFLSIAGLPTATSSRILSMTTGIPSNKMDVILSFFHSSFKSDNLIDQFKDRKIFFYGDNLWVDLYPQLKEKSLPIDSYGNKKNLIKTEKAIINKFLSDINKFDIQFCHLIALDSFGHKYGTNNKIIKEILLIYNNFINNIYKKMDNNTLLVITSDHGVTDQGNHGSSSAYELASVCSFISKKPFIINNNNKNKFLSKFYDINICSTDTDWVKAKEKYDVINQDDIINTVCYLLGTSLPANSCGNFINLLVKEEAYDKLNLIKKNILKSNKININNIDINNLDRVSISYKYSDVIYKHFSKINYFLLIFSISIAIFCTLLTLGFYSFYCFLTAILVFMETISYWTFAYRDLLFIALLLINYSNNNFLLILFYLKNDKINHFESYRVDLKFSEYLKNIDIKIILILFIYNNIIKYKFNNKVLFNNKDIFNNNKFYNNKFYNNKDIFNNKKSFYKNFYIDYNLFLSIIIDLITLLIYNDDNRIYFSSFLNITSLYRIHFSLNHSLLLFMIKYIHLNPMNDYNTSNIKYIYLSLLPNLYNMDYQINLVDFDRLFKLSDKIELFGVLISSFSYFIIPRYLIIKNYKITKFDIFIKSLLISISFIGIYVMRDTLVHNFYFDRLLIIKILTIIDIILEIINK